MPRFGKRYFSAGFLFAALATHLPTWAAIGISSFWFMLGHRGPLAFRLYVLCSGAVMCAAYMRTGCLAPAILLHALHNLRAECSRLLHLALGWAYGQLFVRGQ